MFGKELAALSDDSPTEVLRKNNMLHMQNKGFYDFFKCRETRCAGVSLWGFPVCISIAKPLTSPMENKPVSLYLT